MPTEINPRELEQAVRRAQEGSSEDFHRLYELFSRQIYNFVWRLVGSTEDAEDLTQETFLKVFREIGSLRSPEQFKFWLYRIARNEVYQKQRRSRKDPDVSLDDEGVDYYDFLSDPADTDPEKNTLRREFSQVVSRVLQGMAPKYRDVFVLAVFHKMSYEDITKIVNRSLLSVKTDIYRARITVKKALREYMKGRDRA